ncbi:uncharacterized protein FIBRA_00507 [Fibroporia radiculosa]|uniref:LYR motif-containing protein Cup1-like N-terminal domain-containing protein n=1 Tax=Fibroporia radiculosa TaxID=599839 RepID=J4G0C1_9APHY|nr:uncharacterized protein FIBRA_00507 [Fibroporia radiculosa]CCL98508.1 predicted protein [Fibroporia radiculosa]
MSVPFSRLPEEIFKELARMELANRGVAKRFDHILDLAYGRKGKLKWELMNSILSDPTAPLPERIIPTVEKSRPPVYSAELSALLMSTYSHKKKPLTRNALRSPPTLPARANPESDAARLLGPLSKRRKVNILWRFYTDQIQRVYPPLQVAVESGSAGETRYLTDLTSLKHAGIRAVGMQNQDILQDIQSLATHHTCLANSLEDQEAASPSPLSSSHLSPRFIRRRFAHLLGRLPILTYREVLDTTAQPGQHGGKYRVSISPSAIHPSLRFSPNHLVNAGADDIAWFESAQLEEKMRKEFSKQQRAERLSSGNRSI